MNNSKIVFDAQSREDTSPRTVWLHNREGELIKVIEAIRRVSESEDWKVLKSHVFDGLVETLDRKVKEEASKEEISSPELYRLQGQLAWARKYSDLEKLIEFFKVELQGVRKNIKYGKEND